MIERRDPHDLSALVPWTEDHVICLECRLDFTVERPVGSDYRKAKCPACGKRNADLQAEFPHLQRTIN